MFRHPFSIFDDPFFNASSDMETSFGNLERIMNRPFDADWKTPAIESKSKNREVSLKNDHFGSFFNDFDSHLKGINEMINKNFASFDTNFDPKDSNGSYYSCSSVYSYQNDPSKNEPSVYKARKTVKQGPGGVREEQKAVQDSRRNEEKMAIGRYINDRGREIERKRNTKTGDHEENVNLRGIDESDSNHFDNEWNEMARKHFYMGPEIEQSRRQIGSHSYNNVPKKSHKSKNQLAITDGKSHSRRRN